MIPTMIAIGFLAGLLPRPWYLAGIAIGAAAWPLLRIVSAAAPIDGPSMIGEFAIAVINAAVGAVLARLLVNIVLAMRG
jgi:hypothetical protein